MNTSNIETATNAKYKGLASIYDVRWSNYLNRSFAFLLDFVEISPEVIILDLACGTGELMRLILEKNPTQNITGIDLSPAMLNIAKAKLKKYPQARLVNTSVKKLSFENQFFDLVVCANAFHYFDCPQLVLAEIKRLLKPHGKVIILDWCRDYWFLKICDRIFKISDLAYQGCYTQTELVQLLRKAGFNIKKKSKVRFGLFWELMVMKAEF